MLCLDQLQFLQSNDAQFQRIRVSPDQKYLASSVRTPSDESTCVVVKLDPKPLVVHVLPRAFSFGESEAAVQEWLILSGTT